jgi:hypothetical protein
MFVCKAKRKKAEGVVDLAVTKLYNHIKEREVLEGCLFSRIHCVIIEIKTSEALSCLFCRSSLSL